MKIVNIDKKNSDLPNDFRNFNKIFSKNVSYDFIKSIQKAGFYPLLRKYSFGNKTGEVKLTSQLF